MAASGATKEVYANSIKELLKDMPLNKIAVKDITEHCNLSRNSFYYHFKDKFELINWIFYTDMKRNAKSFNDPSKIAESFVSICKCLYDNKEFYLACFQYTGQNSLFEAIYHLYYDLWKMNLDIRYMTSEVKLTDAELDLMAKLNSCALVGVVIDWVNKGMNEDYGHYIENVKKLLGQEYFTIVPQTSETIKEYTGSV